MRILRLSIVVLASLGLAGCLQSSTLIHVDDDGSGTIEVRLLFTGATLAQLRGPDPFGGGDSQEVDPIPENQAREAASSMGPGVTYVASIPIAEGDAQGRAMVYAFTDINRVRITEQPPAPGGAILRGQGADTGDGRAIAFALARQPDGNLLLRITVPQANAPPADTPVQTDDAPPSSSEQIETIKRLFAGAHLSIAVEPSGRLVRTSSPFVEGRRVTLLDLDFDQAIEDEAVALRLQGVENVDAAKAALKDVPGMKITFDREITIEFAPEN